MLPADLSGHAGKKHVFTSERIDRRFYETCVLSELGKSLRAGDLWVVGSRRYKDFEEYLLPPEIYRAIKPSGLAVDADSSAYLNNVVSSWMPHFCAWID